MPIRSNTSSVDQVYRSVTPIRGKGSLLSILGKILEIFLILACLLIFAGGMYYFYITSSREKPASTQKTVYNAIVFNVTVPLQLLVTYPDGRKAGFDPVTGTTINQITDSKYYLQPAHVDIDNGSYWLWLTDTPQDFNLKIVGEKDQYFGFGIYVYRNNREYNETFSGKIAKGNSADYQIKSITSDKFPLQVTLIK